MGDALSRNPISNIESLDNDVVEHSVCFILKINLIDMSQIALATRSDSELQLLLKAVDENFPDKYQKQLKSFYSFKDEISKKICRHGDEKSIVLLKGDRVIIPESEQAKLLIQAHEGHLGSKKMKEILRTYTYWRGFSKDVDEFVKRCDSCTVYQRLGDRSPLITVSDNTSYPYEKIGIDLTGPSEITAGKVYFTIIDYYSRYPEAFILNHGSSYEILNCLRSTFACFGIPSCIVSDNGSVFHSKEMSEFLASLGIKHVFSSNYFPMGNSTIERFHGTLKHRLKRILNDSDLSHRAAVDKILYDIRSTPNSSTGKTPFSMFFGRPMQTKFSLLNSELSPTSSKQDLAQLYSKKQGRVVEYKVGDEIYYRKGNGDTFSHPGVVTKISPNNAYEINNGRIYNQFHLKRRFVRDNDSHWQNAYDSVVEKEMNSQISGDPINQNLGEGVPITAPNKRYNLRNKTVDSKIYKE